MARVGRWIALSVVCLVVAPAAAGAQLTWQRVADPGPGSTFDYDSSRGPTRVDLAVVGRTPYVSVLSRPAGDTWELTAYRAVDRNTAWRQIGGRLNADPTQPISTPSMEAFADRPYIAYGTDSGVHVLRLSRNGRGFEHIDRGLPSEPASQVVLTVARGRLYLSYVNGAGDTRAARLNRAGNRWEPVASAPDAGSGVFVRGTLYTYTLDFPAPEAPSVFTLYATRRGVTEEAPNPTVAGHDVTDVHLVSADGTLWMIWIEGGGGAMSPPRIVHVARLVRG